jgi:hypothetical protein
MLELNEEDGTWYDPDGYTTVDVDPTNYYETELTADQLAKLDTYDTGDLSGVADTSTGSTTNADGSKTYTYAGGSTVTMDATGKKMLGMTGDTSSKSWESILKSLPAKAGEVLKKLVVKSDGSLDIGNIANGIAALSSLGLSNKPNQAGYNVPIPELSMTRQQVMPNDPNRRPGSGGLGYFTDPKYAKLNDDTAQAAAQAADTAQAAGIRAAYTPATAAVNPYAGKMPTKALTTTATNPMAPAKTAETAVQGRAAEPVAGSRPGAGHQYFTGIKFAPTGGVPAAQTAINTQITDLKTFNAANEIARRPAVTENTKNTKTVSEKPTDTGTQPDNIPKDSYAIGLPTYNADAKNVTSKAAIDADALASNNAFNNQNQPVIEAAYGGIMGLARGGKPTHSQGTYLRGGTDGMADKLDTTIDDKQAAKLSHGEFVIPADVVSHLGNGNSDAGAQKLYDMMARIRKARTGNPEQGKRINPDKFMPGGLAQYNNGGAVAFATGDVVTPASTSKTDVLSEWAGPAVSGMLSKGIAASNAPYQAYKGPLTAGASDLQNQAFAGASDLATTGYTPTDFTTGTFDAAAANKYMNPYINASLDPQLKELQRQSQISNMADAAKLTGAGAFGGSRQAILQGEQNRNLLDKSQDLIGQGYNTAYTNAMAQFNTEQNKGLEAQTASEKSRQYGADYGMKSVKDLADLGATQRGITGEGIAADKTQFEEERDYPLKMAQYQGSLFSKLPITTENKNVNTSDYNNILSKFDDINVQLKRLGVIP